MANIRPNMKVGDTFEDGNLIYRITKCNENGTYESTMVGVVDDTTVENLIEEVKEIAEEKKEVPKPVAKKPTAKKTTTKKK